MEGYGRKTMTTYIALFNLTDAGIKAAKDSPRRLDAAKKLLADMGGEMKQFYLVMGEFDFVGICEAPDDLRKSPRRPPHASGRGDLLRRHRLGSRLPPPPSV
jgi:hypothetical protein